ncbi:MAG TPA: hypothetical protein VGH33_20085, partial [Isosphaeraceae bacterium]
QREKYGSFFYLGIAGLLISLGLVGWFAWGTWSLRDIWTNVYILHDGSRPTEDRIAAAYVLARDGRVTGQQRWDIALRRPLPDLARYLVAESLTTDLVRADPAQFARAVAFSEGWPEWLRLLGLRVVAVAASEGTTFPADALDALERHADPLFACWADYIRALSSDGDRAAAARLRGHAEGQGPEARSARELAQAIEAGSFERATHLAAATRLIRIDSPEAAAVWEGWAEDGEHLERLRR